MPGRGRSTTRDALRVRIRPPTANTGSARGRPHPDGAAVAAPGRTQGRSHPMGPVTTAPNIASYADALVAFLPGWTVDPENGGFSHSLLRRTDGASLSLGAMHGKLHM